MSKGLQDRRHVLKGMLATGSMLSVGAAAAPAWAANSRDEIVEGAKREGGILWYESFAQEEGHAILKAFQRDHPYVRRLDYVRRLAALQPRLVTGTFPLAQSIGAGEMDVGIATYDAAILQRRM